jgi:hypothetical protein
VVTALGVRPDQAYVLASRPGGAVVRVARTVATGVVALALLLACEQDRPVGDGPGTVSPSPTAVARAADLDALEGALGTHPDPPDLDVELDRLRRRADALTPSQWLTELMRVTATRDRDGHTGVFPLAQPQLAVWPVQLYRFADGWRVAAAQAPYADLVGGRVSHVGGLPVEDAVRAVTPLVPHDNPATVVARAPQYLVVPDVLDGLGLAPSLTVDGRTLTPEPVPSEAYATWSGAFYPLVVPRLPPIPTDELVLSRRGRVAVFGYHGVTAASDSTSVDEIAAEITRLVDRREVDRVVVDLRWNSGGENGSYPPLLSALQAADAKRPGTVRVVTGRTTFSAATNFVAELLASTTARSFGEAMGGAPNMWGDAQPHTLPGSQVTVHVATRLWELGGKDLRPTIPPDVPVPLTWADHAAGRDPVLEAAATA